MRRKMARKRWCVDLPDEREQKVGSKSRTQFKQFQVEAGHRTLSCGFPNDRLHT